MTLSKLLAVFAYVDDVCGAVEKLRSEKITIDTVYSPARNEELAEALELKPSPVRWFVLAGGLMGVTFGFGLSVYTAAQWKFVVWGKPPIPIVPYVIESFEFCILFGVLAGLLGLLLLSRMPRFATPVHYDARFTVDRYGVLLTCPAERRASVENLLRESGAEEIRDVAQ